MLSLIENCDAGKRLALEEFERCAPAGRHVAHFRREPRLLHSRGKFDFPLAQSPFPEARPESTSVREPAIARAEQPATTSRATTIGPSSVCFLTVAVNVNSGERLVALHRGTRVRLVREQDGKFLVRSKGTDFLIEKSQITDDLSQVAKLARNSS